nr:hypothetical protein [Tanacetum cinerariifolium]
ERYCPSSARPCLRWRRFRRCTRPCLPAGASPSAFCHQIDFARNQQLLARAAAAEKRMSASPYRSASARDYTSQNRPRRYTREAGWQPPTSKAQLCLHAHCGRHVGRFFGKVPRYVAGAEAGLPHAGYDGEAEGQAGPVAGPAAHAAAQAQPAHGLEVEAGAHKRAGQVAGHFVEGHRHVEARLEVLRNAHAAAQAQLGGQAGLVLARGLVGEERLGIVGKLVDDALNHVVVRGAVVLGVAQLLVVHGEQVALPGHGAEVGGRRPPRCPGYSGSPRPPSASPRRARAAPARRSPRCTRW